MRLIVIATLEIVLKREKATRRLKSQISVRIAIRKTTVRAACFRIIRVREREREKETSAKLVLRCS